METWTGGCLCGAIRYEATPGGHHSIEGKISWLAIADDLPQMRTEEDEWQQKHNDHF